MRNLTLLAVFAASAHSSPLPPQDVMEGLPVEPEAQVTLMNWTEQPYNQWAFRNMGLHPSVMVPRAGNVAELPRAPKPELMGLEFSHAGETYTVGEAMTLDHTDGFIVLHEGAVVCEEYFGDFGEHDHHMWASSAKSLMGVAMGLLADRGKLDVSKQVQDYLPELEETHFGERTVRQVLNMTTAIDYSEDYERFEPGAVSTEYFRRMGFVPAFDLMALDPTKDDTPRGIVGYLPYFKANPELQPDTKYEYHSPNVDVAGWILTRVSGMPLNEFVAVNIWSKLGVEHDAFYITDTSFTPIATGGLSTTLRDFARVGLAFLNHGEFNGQQVFPKAWLNDTFSLTDEERLHTRNSSYKDESSAVFDPWLEGYKNFLWVHDSEKQIGMFRGVFGQNLYIDRDANVVIAAFSSAASASNAARLENKPRMAAFAAIAAHLK